MKTLRVLVVDDEQGVREVVSEAVKSGGFEVVGTARDGVEAVALAEEFRPDVVIMDVLMPRMNGVDAMQAMLEAGTTKRVLLVSGEYRSLGFRRDQLVRDSESAFLEKPFSVGTLFEQLNQWANELSSLEEQSGRV